MSYNRERAIQRAHETINGYELALKLLEQVPQFEQASYYISENTVHVNLPFDWEVYKKYRALLGKNWKDADHCWTATQHSGSNSISYHRNFLPADDPHDNYSLAGVYLMVLLQTGLPGSTCKLKQTGEKVVPVYEVQCD